MKISMQKTKLTYLTISCALFSFLSNHCDIAITAGKIIGGGIGSALGERAGKIIGEPIYELIDNDTAKTAIQTVGTFLFSELGSRSGSWIGKQTAETITGQPEQAPIETVAPKTIEEKIITTTKRFINGITKGLLIHAVATTTNKVIDNIR